MSKARYIGTVALKYLDHHDSGWSPAIMDDIMMEGIITLPHNHLFTLGSGVASHMVSMATTPAYQLPTNSQFYLAGRDVFRWGGPADPYEIDIDHYGFTPDYTRGAVVVWVAPKSEPHHLSQMPHMMQNMPHEWQEFCDAVIKKQL